MLRIQLSVIFVMLLIIACGCNMTSPTFNGVYTNQNTNEYIVMKKDTLRLYRQSESKDELRAECIVKHVKDNWYQANSLKNFTQVPFKNMSLCGSDTTNESSYLKIKILTPNYNNELPVWVESYSRALNKYNRIEATIENGIVTFDVPFSQTFKIFFGYSDITPSVSSGRFYGLLGYSKEIKLNSTKVRGVELSFPNITEEIMNEYYIRCEFINITDSCIYRKGTKYLRHLDK